VFKLIIGESKKLFFSHIPPQKLAKILPSTTLSSNIKIVCLDSKPSWKVQDLLNQREVNICSIICLVNSTSLPFFSPILPSTAIKVALA